MPVPGPTSRGASRRSAARASGGGAGPGDRRRLGGALPVRDGGDPASSRSARWTGSSAAPRPREPVAPQGRAPQAGRLVNRGGDAAHPVDQAQRLRGAPLQTWPRPTSSTRAGVRPRLLRPSATVVDEPARRRGRSAAGRARAPPRSRAGSSTCSRRGRRAVVSTLMPSRFSSPRTSTLKPNTPIEPLVSTARRR